jgi:GT2 family glycosyltransferase
VGDSSICAVLVNYNGGRFLNECLRRLQAAVRPGDEVVVVDNASIDGSVAALLREFPQVAVLRQPRNVGVAAGNNIGVRHALARGHAYVLLLNYDTRPSPDLIDELLAAADSRTLVTANTLVWDDANQSNSHAGGFDWWLGRLREPFLGTSRGEWPTAAREVDIADTCCLLVPRLVFETIGFMDEAYFLYYDDTDFVVRARRAGFRCLFQPRATLEHYERGASGPVDDSPVSVYYTSRNRLYFMRKHARSLAPRAVFLAFFACSRALHMGWWLLTGRTMLVRSARRGIADYLRGRMGAAGAVPAPAVQQP